MKRVNSASGFTSLLAPPTHHTRAPTAATKMRALADVSAAATTTRAALDSDEAARDAASVHALDDVASNNSTASSTSSTYSSTYCSTSTFRPSTTVRTATSTVVGRSKDSSSVRVAVRIRPLLPKEIAANERACVERDANSVTVAATEKRFTFDHVFPVSATQSEMYDAALQPLMDSFLNGFNVTVIAYGQTGSGKTFTMGNSIAASATSLIASRLFAPTAAAPVKSANASDTATTTAPLDTEGLIPRFLHELFERLRASECADGGTGDSVSVSFLEIYGEEIHDLLQSSARRNQDDNAQSLQLRESSAGVYVQGLTEVRVSNRRDALEQMRVGSLRRATGSTEMNEHSSRSHAVYTVKIVRRVRRHESIGGHSAATIASQRRAVETDRRLSFGASSNSNGVSVSCDSNNADSGDSSADATIVSKLTFVDLAGSERLKRTLAEGSRMKEGIQINVGLLALGNVINALGDKTNRATGQVHVPYRSSKLTRLLQDALGGNSRTLFIACVSPAEVNASETLNTLQYANRAKNIQNKAVKNIDSRSAELLGLKAFNALLRRELVKARFGPASTGAGAVAADASQIDAMVDALLSDPTVQNYLRHLEQLAMDAGASGDFDALDTDLSALARLTAQLSMNSVAPVLPSGAAISAQRSEPSPLPESDEPHSSDVSVFTSSSLNTATPPFAMTLDHRDAVDGSSYSTTRDDSRAAELAEQLALWKQKCDESDRDVARLEVSQSQLLAELAARVSEANALQTRVAELETNLAIARGKEEAFQLLDRCQEVWNELGLNAEDQAGKFKDINELLLKKCAEELEGLEAAREKLRMRIDAAYARVRRLEQALAVDTPIDMAQLPVLAGRTLLAQEKHLLVAQRQLEDELRRRFHARVWTLRSVRDLALDMALAGVADLRHAQLDVDVDGCSRGSSSTAAPDISELFETLCALEACGDADEQLTVSIAAAAALTVVDAVIELPGLDLSETALQRDTQLLTALRDEKTKRVAEADDALRSIRSVTQQLRFTYDDLVHVLQKTAAMAATTASASDAVGGDATATAPELLTDEALRDVARWILDVGESVGVATAVLQLLAATRRSVVDVYDGRANALSYVHSTLDDALALARATLGDDASVNDARALLSGDDGNADDSSTGDDGNADDSSTGDTSALGCSFDALAAGAQRLAQLGAPIEASLRALLLSLDAEFTAFGIETDAQRISFLLGGSDDDDSATSATRETLERYITGDWDRNRSDDSVVATESATTPIEWICPTESTSASQSFLSDLDPAFRAFGAVYTAAHSKRLLARLDAAIADVRVVQRTLASAQRRLASLQRIMKLFGEIRAFQTRLASFEATAADKNRLFGSSLRLLEEEKFRRSAAKRYPSLLAALRSEVAKWLANDGGEFDLRVLGQDLKLLLLDMVNTDTGLMHLDLGVVVTTTRAATRRLSKTQAVTPTRASQSQSQSSSNNSSSGGCRTNSQRPGSAQKQQQQQQQQPQRASASASASALVRSRSMTGVVRDASAKKRLAFEH